MEDYDATRKLTVERRAASEIATWIAEISAETRPTEIRARLAIGRVLISVGKGIPVKARKIEEGEPQLSDDEIHELIARIVERCEGAQVEDWTRGVRVRLDARNGITSLGERYVWLARPEEQDGGEGAGRGSLLQGASALVRQQGEAGALVLRAAAETMQAQAQVIQQLGDVIQEERQQAREAEARAVKAEEEAARARAGQLPWEVEIAKTAIKDGLPVLAPLLGGLRRQPGAAKDAGKPAPKDAPKLAPPAEAAEALKGISTILDGLTPEARAELRANPAVRQAFADMAKEEEK